jgi:hypothetical protein
MAKPTYNKLGLKPNLNKTELSYKDQIIEIKQYLPINEKLRMVGNILDMLMMDNELKFRNFGKEDMYFYLYLIYNYTNLSFTEKQKEDPSKLYDNLYSSGFLSQVIELIPEEEYESIKYIVFKTIKDYYKQKNSVMGLIEAFNKGSDDLSQNLAGLYSEISDPENITLLKAIMDKLG